MENQPLFAVIVAGGSGTRMQSEIPKQFLLLDGKPILLHTIERFLKIEGCEVILVLPESERTYWQTEVVEKFTTSLTHNNAKLTLTNGGVTRFQSVKNGLGAIKSNHGLVAVHDGVRPIISESIIMMSYEVAASKKAVVISVNLKDSIREVMASGKNMALDRTKYKLMQTPQTFDLQLLRKAYAQEELPTFTDDASVVENLGHPITLIAGDYKNIKITTPEDLKIAEVLLKLL